jgi:hypothetical protein
LAFTEESLKQVHQAMQEGRNIRVKAFNPADVQTKAFSSVDSLLPAELFGGAPPGKGGALSRKAKGPH